MDVGIRRQREHLKELAYWELAVLRTLPPQHDVRDRKIDLTRYDGNTVVNSFVDGGLVGHFFVSEARDADLGHSSDVIVLIWPRALVR